MLPRGLILIALVAVAAVGISFIGNAYRPNAALAAAPQRDLIEPQPGAAVSSSDVALVGGTPSGPRVQLIMPPVGLSLEYPLMAQDLGPGACPPPALVAEMLRLGSPPLALAGQSQDLTAPSGALTGSPSSWEAA